MKKMFMLGLILSAIISTSAYAQPKADLPAQPPMDQAAMLKQMKEKFKTPMMEKTGLTESQADKVFEINLAIRVEAAAAIQGLNEADRSKKLAEFKAEKEKRYAAIPLTSAQISSVYAFYEDLGKNNPPRSN